MWTSLGLVAVSDDLDKKSKSCFRKYRLIFVYRRDESEIIKICQVELLKFSLTIFRVLMSSVTVWDHVCLSHQTGSRCMAPNWKFTAKVAPKQNFHLYKQSFPIKRWTEVLRSSSRSRWTSGRRQKFVKITKIKYTEDAKMTGVGGRTNPIKSHASSSNHRVRGVFACVFAPRSCSASGRGNTQETKLSLPHLSPDVCFSYQISSTPHALVKTRRQDCLKVGNVWLHLK